MLFLRSMAFAQTSDPVIMTINGKPVHRSEFEYSYNKNNSDGVIDKKTVREYVELFINYKLKVEAALDAHLDTMSSFLREFTTYRNQQIRPSIINDADVEIEARRIYAETQQKIDSNGGIIKPAQILIALKQRTSKAEENCAKIRADSVYRALQHGADFAQLAKNISDDKSSSDKGGELPWLQKGQTFQEFENVAFNLRKGQISLPVLSPIGYHIILMKDRSMFFPYDSVRSDIMRFIDQRSIREKLINARLDTLSKVRKTTKSEILKDQELLLEQNNPDLKYLIQEYHDGLLLYEISNRVVWDRADKDKTGLENYFRHNKKKYRWEQPRFKGIAYYVKDKSDIKAVRKTVKNLDFDKWGEVLHKTFNSDSVVRVKVEKGIFKQGDNNLVDNEVFDADNVIKPIENYPYFSVYGKKLKAPKTMQDIRPLVIADYQDALEGKWVESLREKYKVTVDKEVLSTVNKH